jgi:CheY-like chemotaxis protein
LEVFVKRCLIVDDMPQNRQIARRVLEREGYQVEETASTNTAWVWLSTGERFDLLITDHHAKGEMTGLELLQCLKDKERFSELKRVLMSGSTTVSDTDLTPLQKAAEAVGAVFWDRLSTLDLAERVQELYTT